MWKTHLWIHQESVLDIEDSSTVSATVRDRNGQRNIKIIIESIYTISGPQIIQFDHKEKALDTVGSFSCCSLILYLYL